MWEQILESDHAHLSEVCPSASSEEGDVKVIIQEDAKTLMGILVHTTANSSGSWK
jgi:hypothetical protein